LNVKTTPRNTAKLAQSGALKARDGASPQAYSTGGDTAAAVKVVPEGEMPLAEVVAKAKAAAEAPPPEAAPGEAPSLEIPGVPVGQDLPVTVKAQITVKGTARVLEMTDDTCTIKLHVKGHALFIPIERDVTVSLSRQADGTYLYKYTDNRSGETSEGVAKNIVVEGNTRRLDVRDVHSDEDVPIAITDMGGGRFVIKGDGFEADINRV